MAAVTILDSVTSLSPHVCACYSWHNLEVRAPVVKRMCEAPSNGHNGHKMEFDTMDIVVVVVV